LTVQLSSATVPAVVETNVIGTVKAVPAVAVVGNVPTSNVPSVAPACAGTAENPAMANADAATSAMRLKLVFVDIIFLSRKVAEKNFFPAAWPKMPDS
jgi:hypothetical protein